MCTFSVYYINAFIHLTFVLSRTDRHQAVSLHKSCLTSHVEVRKSSADGSDDEESKQARQMASVQTGPVGVSFILRICCPRCSSGERFISTTIDGPGRSISTNPCSPHHHHHHHRHLSKRCHYFESSHAEPA